MAEILTQSGFDKLLATLDADREQAGLKYESLRARLVKFFEWRSCERAEELADTVFDRIVKKIAAGEEIQNLQAYSATVAQFVCREDSRRPGRLHEPIDDDSTVSREAVETALSEDPRMQCLDKCLAEFPPENRRLVIAYYDTDERTMIASRKSLADSVGISLNTLRIRVCRLKAKLENCTRACCEARQE